MVCCAHIDQCSVCFCSWLFQPQHATDRVCCCLSCRTLDHVHACLDYVVAVLAFPLVFGIYAVSFRYYQVQVIEYRCGNAIGLPSLIGNLSLHLSTFTFHADEVDNTDEDTSSVVYCALSLASTNTQQLVNVI
jgi:hypothetical protein